MESESDSSPTAATLLPAETHRQKSPNRRGPPPPCHAFGVAIVCALPIEATAVATLFDETWDDVALAKAPTDTNAYSVGAIGAHRVVLVHLPSMGKVASATGAGNLRSSFPRLGLVLLVGICGGAPKVSAKKSDELLLGDVVVSTGVVQYDRTSHSSCFISPLGYLRSCREPRAPGLVLTTLIRRIIAEIAG